MTRYKLCVVVMVCLFALVGCGQKNIENTRPANEIEEIVKEAVPTGEYVPVTEFTMLPVPDNIIHSGNGDCFYINGEILYLEMDRAEAENEGQAGRLESRLLAVAADGTAMPRTIVESREGSYLENFFVDKAGNLYLCEEQRFYNDESDKRESCYYLEKRDPDGKELFKVELTEAVALLDDVSGGDFVKIYADGEGNIALVEFSSQQILFLDSEGQYQGKADMGGMVEKHFITNNIVCAGGRYFLWAFDYAENSIILTEIDFAKRLVGEAVKINVSSLVKRLTSWDCMLLDGDGSGLLVSTKDVLWQYDLETGAATEVFRWDDKNVDLDGRCVAQISWGTVGEEGTPMDILVYEDCVLGLRYANLMAVSVTYTDKAYLPKRRVINIGINKSQGNIGQIVSRFNRLNREYEAVLVEYSANDLQELLMYGGEVPDLLDITGIRTGWLETKNLLEDLVPYFENSNIISKEDILPCVWELLEKDGKLTSMATSFTIGSMITTADIPEDGWDYELYLGLGEQYPESWYFNTYNAMQVWGAVSVTGIEDYIDWGKRKCYFNNKDFRELLEAIKRIRYPRAQVGGNASTKEQLEKLMSQQVLFQMVNYGSVHGYDEKQSDSGGRIKSVGYPDADGEPVFLFSASQNLAIYGESSEKDGAWAFLEFLLSEKEQSWYASEKEVFPVNEEAFEEYLVRPYYLSTANVIMKDNIEVLEDTPDKFRYMVEHLGLNQNATDEIYFILSEELQAYFKGDKTVEEAAKIIQNRVQLYLDEL